MIDKQKIVSSLGLVEFGSKGWFSSPSVGCPHCGRTDKFGIFIEGNKGGVHCFYDDFSESIFSFLKRIGKAHLLGFENDLESFDFKLIDIDFVKDSKSKEDLVKIDLPYKFKPVYFDEYLNNRGFTPYQYKLFNVGKSEGYLLNDYVIFVLYDDENNCVGWLGRSKKSKKWHEDNLKHFKETGEGLVLRYRNSTGADFGKILLGEKEITNNTETIYIVEGLFDKANVDRKLGLYKQEKYKCCCSFGNKISDDQIEILRKYKSIKNLVFLYDFGTTVQVKDYGMKCSLYWNVKVGIFKDKDIDAGDADENYLKNIISNLQNINYFYTLKLS